MDATGIDAAANGWISGAAQAKQNPETRAIPVIILTARIDPESECRCHRSGAVHYIKKPWGQGELEDRIAIDSFPLHFGRRIIGSHGGETRPDVHIPHYLRLYELGKLKHLEDKTNRRRAIAPID